MEESWQRKLFMQMCMLVSYIYSCSSFHGTYASGPSAARCEHVFFFGFLRLLALIDSIQVWAFATEQQRERWLPKIISGGERACFAVTEVCYKKSLTLTFAMII